MLGRLLGSNWITLAAAALIGGLLGAALLTSNPRAAIVERSAVPRMRVGEPSTVRVVVTNPRRLRRFGPLLVTDRAPGLPDATVLVPSLAPTSAAVAEIVRTPQVRGHWSGAGTLTVEAQSPLGGFARRCVWTWHEPTIVHPKHAPPVPLSVSASPRRGVDRGSGRPGQGTEVLGVREWRPGDPRASVHWRSSARHGQLLVLERELPQTDDLIIALGQPGEGDAWELAISRFAATAAAAHRAGRRVLLVTGDGFTTPASVTACLDWFAGVEALPAATKTQIVRVATTADTPIIWLTTQDGP